MTTNAITTAPRFDRHNIALQDTLAEFIAQGMTQRQAAEAVGTAPSNVSVALRMRHARLHGTPAPTRRAAAAAARWVSARTFGVEIECVGISRETAAAALAPVLGYTPRITGYHGDSSYTEWTVQYDGSLVDRTGRGSAEVVTRVLQGDAGLAELRAGIDALAAAGATVNVSCGQHVHHSIDDLDGDALALFVENFARLQPLMSKLVAPSRRHNGRTHNGYTNYAGASIRPDDVRRLTTAARTGWQASNGRRSLTNGFAGRYTRLNVNAYVERGTVEFRQHQGTVDSAKTLAWVRFGQAIVEASARGERLTPGGALTKLGRLGLLDATEVAFLTERAAWLTLTADEQRAVAAFAAAA